jgi:hypothetical protein
MPSGKRDKAVVHDNKNGTVKGTTVERDFLN